MLKKLIQLFQKQDSKDRPSEEVVGFSEQVQLLISWPGKGFKTDSIRLSSLESEEWIALHEMVEREKNRFPVLAETISRPFPTTCPRNKIDALKTECDENTDYEKMDTPEMSGLSSISFHISQAIKQNEASITFDCWKGEYFEGHTFVKNGVNLLEDLKEINNA